MFDWITTRKLNRIADAASPDAKFVHALEQKIKAGMPARHPHSLMWKTAFGSLTALTLLLSGTGVYAYSSDDVLPDHPLYPVRTGIEQVEQSLAVTPRLKAAVAVRLLTRRVKERDLLLERKKQLAPDQEVRVLQTLDHAIEAGDTLDIPSQTRFDAAIMKLESKLEDRVSTTTVEVPTSTPELAPNRAPIVEQLERIKQRIEQLPPARRAVYESLLQNRIERRLELRQRLRLDRN